MTIMKRTLKVIMIIIMLAGITMSIFNLLTTDIQAGGGGIGTGFSGSVNNPIGTTVELPGGGEDCQGAPLDC